MKLLLQWSVCCWLLLSGVKSPAQPAESAHPVVQQRAALDAKFAGELAQLAQRCRELGLDEAAQRTLDCRLPDDRVHQRIFLPSAAPVTATELAADTPQQHWQRHLARLKREHAARLFQLAQQIAESEPADSYALLHELLHYDPDHAAARQILGYRQVEQHWRRAGDDVVSRLGQSPQRQYGFAPRKYYQVTSAHFALLTNGDQSQALEIVRRLEDVHAVWRQLFYRYWSDGPTLARRFAAGVSDYRPRRDKHRVVWFSTREEYIAALQRDEPLIDKTLGIYLDKRRTAFLYGDPAEEATNWIHELTHQLFAEQVRTAPNVASRHNVWIVEGIALYMESLRWHDDYVTLGGFDADRLQFARYRALNDRLYVPLAEFVRMGREQMQQDERIGALYSQSAGLAHFLMDGDGRRYRRALVEYLAAVYQGRDTPASLAALTGAAYSELDTRYLDFLNVTDEQLAYCLPVVNLHLGHTSITDTGLQHVPLENLEWLDVGFTTIGDASVERLAAAGKLRKLSLEATQVTSAGIAALSGLTQLQYLDLSSLPIDDDALAALRDLAQLESLWLTGTRITDRGLGYLKHLRSLATLDVSRSGVTAEGLKQLKEQLPRLNE